MGLSADEAHFIQSLIDWRREHGGSSRFDIAPEAELMRGGVDYLSTSHRNMERSGMRLLFPRAAWTPLD